MSGNIADKQARLGAKQTEVSVFNDNTTFMMDEGLYITLYNMWGGLSANIDIIQNEMIADEEYDSSVVCFVCKTILDYVCHIIKANVFGRNVTTPIRTSLTVDLDAKVNADYFNEPTRLRALNALFIMLTRNMSIMNTDGKNKIIDYTYTIKNKLTNN